jgi:hypothetical protein
MTLFDHLENITLHKKRWKQLTEEQKKTANIYMLSRFISMSYPYIEMVNELQQLNLPPDVLYNMYSALLPKQKTFFKYIKKEIKDGKKEAVELLAEVFEVSQKEAKGYLDLLDKKQLEEVTNQVKGIKDKKPKK